MGPRKKAKMEGKALGSGKPQTDSAAHGVSAPKPRKGRWRSHKRAHTRKKEVTVGVESVPSTDGKATEDKFDVKPDWAIVGRSGGLLKKRTIFSTDEKYTTSLRCCLTVI
jgi:hypothetical protein